MLPLEVVNSGWVLPFFALKGRDDVNIWHPRIDVSHANSPRADERDLRRIQGWHERTRPNDANLSMAPSPGIRKDLMCLP
jgi:hypothetical protein